MFATKAGVLPWTPESARDAVVEWFNVWLDERDGVDNLEIMKALDRFKDFFARHGRSRLPMWTGWVKVCTIWPAIDGRTRGICDYS